MFKVFPYRLPQGNCGFLTACCKRAKSRFPYRPQALPARRAQLSLAALPRAASIKNSPSGPPGVCEMAGSPRPPQNEAEAHDARVLLLLVVLRDAGLAAHAARWGKKSTQICFLLFCNMASAMVCCVDWSVLDIACLFVSMHCICRTAIA